MREERPRAARIEVEDVVNTTHGDGSKGATFKLKISATDEEMGHAAEQLVDSIAEATGGKVRTRDPFEPSRKSHFVGATKWTANWVPSKDRLRDDPSAN